MESSQDKSLPATARKLQKTREDGQTSRSRDLGHLAVLGMGLAMVLAGGPTMLHHMQVEVASHFSFDRGSIIAPDLMLERLISMFTVGLVGVVVLAVCINAVSILLMLMSGGWVFSWKPISPKFSKLNPLKGITNVFSKQQVITAVKNVILTLILGTVAWLHISGGLTHIAKLPNQASAMALVMVRDWIVSGIALLMLVVFAMALVDVPLQKFLFLQRLKMSHQEVKQEHKESEGSPEVKGKIRQKQREMAHRASVNRVHEADFVVTNPTHYSVALRYDDKTMAAPQVVAMGADLIALKIREVAKAHEVPVLESPMLARALYAHAELDQAIPSQLYTAVAQVLAYVYRLKASLRGQAAAPGDLVQPDVPPELDPHYKKPSARSSSGAANTNANANADADADASQAANTPGRQP